MKSEIPPPQPSIFQKKYLFFKLVGEGSVEQGRIKRNVKHKASKKHLSVYTCKSECQGRTSDTT